MFVVTGAGTPPGLPAGETDGPPGAAALARAIEFGLGGTPILISEERNMPAVIKVRRGRPASPSFDEDLFKQRRSCAMAINFPLGDARQPEAAGDSSRSTACWRMGLHREGRPNTVGVYHSIKGRRAHGQDRQRPPFGRTGDGSRHAFRQIGVAGSGNEIGCGLIKEAVATIQPFGKDCGCPCHGGVGTVTECDVLVFAAVSNWGAYGIAAALAGLLGERDVLHDEATELRIIHACVAGGAMDGAYSRLIPYVDGTSDRMQAYPRPCTRSSRMD